MPQAPRVVGLAEAAQRFRLPYERCYRLVLTGVLPARKSGGRWMLSTDDVERVANQLNAAQRERTSAVNMGGQVSGLTKRELEDELNELRQELATIEDEHPDWFEEDEADSEFDVDDHEDEDDCQD